MRCIFYIATLFVMLVVGTTSVWGADKTYIGSEGSWGTPGNWSSYGVPSSGDYVTIPNGAIVTITEGTYTIAALKVEARGTLIVKGAVTLVFYQENQGNQKEAGKATIFGTVIFENDFDGSGAVGTLKAQSNNYTKGNSLISLESGASVSGAGNIEAKVVDINPGADLSGYVPANKVGSTTYYIEGTGVEVTNGALCSKAYIFENSVKKTNQRVYYGATIIVQGTGSTVTFHNGGKMTMKSLSIASGCTATVENASGVFNGAGTLKITGTKLTKVSGEENTFDGLKGDIFENGTVYVASDPWPDGVNHIYYPSTSGNWGGDNAIKWSVDANRKVVYCPSINGYKSPGDDKNGGDIAIIPSGMNVTITASPFASAYVYGNLTIANDVGALALSRKIDRTTYGENNKLVAYPGSKVVVNGKIRRANRDQIIVYHTYANSASFYLGSGASFIDLSSTEVAKELNVRHKIKGGRTYYMGASTEDGTISFPSSVGAYTTTGYSASSESFSSGAIGSGTHRTGTIKITTAGTISETGIVPFGDKSYTLTKGAGLAGWNLLSNPFTTALPLEPSSFGFTDGDVDPTIWFRVKDGDYKFLTYSMKTGVQSPAASDGGMGGPIAPQQTFYVKANRATSFTVKYPSSGASGASLKSASIAPDDVLRLTISSDGCNTDEVALVFRDGGDLGSVYGDAEKRSENATYNELYAMKGSKRCVIPFYPEVGAISGEELPLGFRLSSKSTKGIITATNLEEFGVANDIYLVDKQENVVVNLTEEMSYEFTSEAGKENTGRFAIVIGGEEQEENCDESIATGIENIKAENTLVFDSEGVVVNLARGDRATLRVYDSVGKLVKSVMVKKQETIVPIQGRGLYIAELVTEEGAVRAKALVK